MLSDPRAVRPTFVVDRPGNYVVRLLVNDGTVDSKPDRVTISTTNSKPIANAGPDQTVFVGDMVQLEGRGSRDADGDLLTFRWSLTSLPVGSTATLSDPNAVQPSFDADRHGVYVAQLIVNDGTVDSTPDTLLITVTNQPPVLGPIGDQTVVVGNTLPLQLTATDPDGDALTFSAEPLPAHASLDAATGRFSFTPTIDQTGKLSISFTVSDGTLTDNETIAITVQGPPPTLTAFATTSGRADDTITLTGTNLDTTLRVAINGVEAPFTVVSPTQVRVTVPKGATSGAITITTPGGSFTTLGNFVVLSSPNFALSAIPASATTLQGARTNYSRSVTGVEGFTSLVSLSVSGLPQGVIGQFAAPMLTARQSTDLTLVTSTTTPVGLATFTVTGSADLPTGFQSQAIPLTLEVLRGGRTSLAGQFLTNDGGPLPGVRLKLATLQTQTDGAGNFLFLDVPAGTQQLAIDANAARPGFPIYGVDVTLTAGVATVLPPFQITPPPPPERFTPINNAMADQVFTDPRMPGVEITLPKGATIMGWEGTLKTHIAIERHTPDKLAVPPPPGPTRSLYQIHFGTPMGGVPSAPLSVTLPNDLDLEPGQQAELWYYDASPLGGPAAWRMAGMGTVSADGRKIVSDPGVGVQRFCGVCGKVCWVDRMARQVNSQPPGSKTTSGEPVDLATGLFNVDKTDLVLPGRLPAIVARSYNQFDPFGLIARAQPALGLGWYLSVDVFLLPINDDLVRLILPGNSRLPISRQPDGTFQNTTHPFLSGAVLNSLGGGDHQLRFKDGTTWRFRPMLLGLEFLVEIADRNNNRLTIQRDLGGRIQRIIEPAGRALEVTYAGSQISQITDPIGRTVRYGYEGGRLTAVTDTAGGVTRYTDDTAGRMLTITDPKGITFIQNEYSPGSGRVLSQIQADGGEWRFVYELQGATATGGKCVTPPPGMLFKRLLTCPPTVESVETVAAGWTFTGGVIVATTVIDPRGNLTTYRFTSEGFTREITDALGQTTFFERDAAGRILSATDPLGRMARFTYNADGTVATTSDTAGNVWTITYDPTFSNITSITDPLGNMTTFEYDAAGNIIATTDPEQNRRPEAERLKTRVAYNQFGQPVSVTDPLGNTTMLMYNSQGDLATIIDALGSTASRSFDAVSRLIRWSDARGTVTRFSYDPLNRLTDVIDALGGTSRFAYDANGNLLIVTDARGNKVTHEYDSMDRLSRRIDQLGNVETFTYDGNRNLVTATDRKGQTTTFTYDALDRSVQFTFSDGTAAGFQYDTAYRLIRADDTADPHRPITLEYDSLGRLLAETTAMGTVSYQYDALGRRTRMTVSGQAPVSYTYDANSRLRPITQSPLAPVDIQYDVLGRRTSLRLPNGVNTEYQYDAASRLTALIYRNPFGLLGDLKYQYDAAGNRMTVGGSFARTLLPEPVLSATYDAADRLLTFGSRTAMHDAEGNMTSISSPSGTTTVEWDARNRLSRVRGQIHADFAYDVTGRRAFKAIEGTITSYGYDGIDGAREIRGGAEVGVLRTLSLDELLAESGDKFHLGDALGSTIALTDASGQIVASYTYDPYGRASVVGPATNPYQYTGRELDSDTLYYYRARYYNPELGRFLQEDPIGLAGGHTNLYDYVITNPINWVDPMGLKVQVPSPGLTYGDYRRTRPAPSIGYPYRPPTIDHRPSRDPLRDIKQFVGNLAAYYSGFSALSQLERNKQVEESFRAQIPYGVTRPVTFAYDEGGNLTIHHGHIQFM